MKMKKLFIIITSVTALFSAQNGDVYTNLNRINELGSKQTMNLALILENSDTKKISGTNDSALAIFNQYITENGRINIAYKYNKDPYDTNNGDDAIDFDLGSNIVLLSYDYNLKNQYLFGIIVGYEDINTFYDNDSENDKDSYSASIYFKYKIPAIELGILINYNYGSNDMDRVSVTDYSHHTSSYNDMALSTYAYIKNDFHLNEFFTLTPIASFTYSYISHDDIDENDINGVYVTNQQVNSILPAFDLVTKFTYANFSFSISNGFTYEAGNIYDKAENVGNMDGTHYFHDETTDNIDPSTGLSDGTTTTTTVDDGPTTPTNPNDLYTGGIGSGNYVNYRADIMMLYKHLFFEHLNMYLHYRYETRYNYMDYDVGLSIEY